MQPLYWSLLLLGMGALVIVIEMFIPSAGVLAIVATVLLVSGIVMAFVHSMPAGAIVLLATVMAIPGLLMLLVKIWPSTPIGKRILLRAPEGKDVLPNESETIALKELVGHRGVALTAMLPSGIVRVDGQSHDAVCEGFAVDPGQNIKVVAVRFNRIYVQPYDPAEDLETDFSNDLLNKSASEFDFGPIDSDPGKS